MMDEATALLERLRARAADPARRTDHVPSAFEQGIRSMSLSPEDRKKWGFDELYPDLDAGSRRGCDGREGRPGGRVTDRGSWPWAVRLPAAR